MRASAFLRWHSTSKVLKVPAGTVVFCLFPTMQFHVKFWVCSFVFVVCALKRICFPCLMGKRLPFFCEIFLVPFPYRSLSQRSAGRKGLVEVSMRSPRLLCHPSRLPWMWVICQVVVGFEYVKESPMAKRSGVGSWSSFFCRTLRCLVCSSGLAQARGSRIRSRITRGAVRMVMMIAYGGRFCKGGGCCARPCAF